MARTVGFQYYKVDTDRYDDMRIRKLRRAHGTKGIAVYDYLLAQVYKEHGCYVHCDADCLFDLTDYFDISDNAVKEIVSFCASVGLFDKGLLMRENVLTSHAIQRRFADMCKASKRLYVEIPKEILLVTSAEIGASIKHPFFVKKPGFLSDTPEETVETPEEIAETPEDSHKTPEEKPERKNSGGNGKNSGGFAKTPEETVKTPEDDKRKEPKENKSHKSIKVEPSTKAEDSLSDFQESSDVPSAVSPSLFGDEVLEEKADRFSHDELIKFWNTVTGGVYGKLIRIDNNRLTMTLARIREYGKEAFFQAIRNAAASEYLKTVTWFNYDWMIKPNNFVKVFEDKYGKKERVDSAGSGGLGPAGLASANSIPMGGGEARVETTYRKRVYD